MDFGAYYEADLIFKMWPNGQQPQAEVVIIENKTGLVSLSTMTIVASISFLILPIDSKEKITQNSNWKLYTKPFTLQKGYVVYAKASRIGFKESEISKLIIN